MLYYIENWIIMMNQSLLSDQAMCLSSIKKHAMGGRFSGLGCTFQGQKHGCKDFGIPEAHILQYSSSLGDRWPLHPV